MLATTISPETSTATPALRVTEAPAPKTEAVEKREANQPVKSAIAPKTMTAPSPEEKTATAPTKTVKAAAKVMVQPAHQWRNCSKPHRI